MSVLHGGPSAQARLMLLVYKENDGGDADLECMMVVQPRLSLRCVGL